jgi:hypothetical protein
MVNRINLSINVDIRIGKIRSVRLGANIRLNLEVHCAHLEIIRFIGNSIRGEQHLGVYSNIKGATTLMGPS